MLLIGMLVIIQHAMNYSRENNILYTEVLNAQYLNGMINIVLASYLHKRWFNDAPKYHVSRLNYPLHFLAHNFTSDTRRLRYC